jgi:hypothetical protein
MTHRVVIALLAVIIAVQASCGGPDSWPHERFDARRWRETKDEERYPMAQDLIDRRVLIGLNQPELQQLLGAPGFWGLKHEDCTYVVKLGGSGFDQVFILDVGFDPTTSKVASARVRGK